MVVHGSEDNFADRQGSLACFDELGADDTEYVEMCGVDHYMMHSDRRDEIFETTHDFRSRMG
jgi:esterase/lipase